MGHLRRLGGWGSPGESLIGTLCGKRNELVCCSVLSRGRAPRRGSSHVDLGISRSPGCLCSLMNLQSPTYATKFTDQTEPVWDPYCLQRGAVRDCVERARPRATGKRAGKTGFNLNYSTQNVPDTLTKRHSRFGVGMHTGTYTSNTQVP